MKLFFGYCIKKWHPTITSVPISFPTSLPISLSAYLFPSQFHFHPTCISLLLTFTSTLSSTLPSHFLLPFPLPHFHTPISLTLHFRPIFFPMSTVASTFPFPFKFRLPLILLFLTSFPVSLPYRYHFPFYSRFFPTSTSHFLLICFQIPFPIIFPLSFPFPLTLSVFPFPIFLLFPSHFPILLATQLLLPTSTSYIPSPFHFPFNRPIYLPLPLLTSNSIPLCHFRYCFAHWGEGWDAS